MQRVSGLFEQFCSFPNLYSAWKKTKKGSGYSRESAQFFQEMEKELFDLQYELQTGTWHPQLFRYFDIYDPKHRTIAVSSYRDRVIHHALVNVLEPVFELIFIDDSYATRKNKGVHAAVLKAQYFLKSYGWYVKSDVDKFFDSVVHDVLMIIIQRKIKDRRLLEICEKIIRHGGVNGRGLPIGNRTSQFFANVYLNPLDHFVKERLQLKGYVRYMDDFVVFDADRAVIKHHFSSIGDYLAETLQLQLKPQATWINSRQHGLPFLGRRIFPSVIRFRRENLRRIMTRMQHREQQYMSGDISEEMFLCSMNSYWAMLSYHPEHTHLRHQLLKGKA